MSNEFDGVVPAAPGTYMINLDGDKLDVVVAWRIIDKRFPGDYRMQPIGVITDVDHDGLAIRFPDGHVVYEDGIWETVADYTHWRAAKRQRQQARSAAKRDAAE